MCQWRRKTKQTGKPQVVKVMGKDKALVKVNSEGKYVVDIEKVQFSASHEPFFLPLFLFLRRR